MRLRTMAGALSALALALSACGGTGESAGPVEVPATTAAPALTQAPAPVATAPTAIDVKAGESPLGDLLTGPEGLTLYGFTNDVDATSTCYGTCADAWPPVLVPVNWTAGPGLDFGIFATTVREDGTLQLVSGKWPLYYFAGDAAPGDTSGQGSGDVWFAAGIDGRLIETDGDGDVAAAPEPAPAAAQPVTIATTDLGETLTDTDGLTLYGFLNDVDGASTCVDACAGAWPPLLVDGDAVPEGLDAGVFSIIERADGTSQLKAGAWPLYRFAGDSGPGDVSGQSSGGVWFVAAPDGSLIGALTGDAGDMGSGYDS